MWTPDPSVIITAEAKQPEVQAALLAGFRAAVQDHLDAKARERQYDNGHTLASYVTSTNATWAAEAQAFVAWRDAVWTYALAELDRVQGKEREVPTVDAFIAELPSLEWEAG